MKSCLLSHTYSGLTSLDQRTAMHLAVSSLLHRADLIQRCDALHYGVTENSMADGIKSVCPLLCHRPRHSDVLFRSSPFMSELLRQLVTAGLVDQAFSTTMNPSAQNETSRIQSELHESNTQDMEVWLFSTRVLAGPDDISIHSHLLSPGLLSKSHSTISSHFWTEYGKTHLAIGFARKSFVR